jgi:hypothetical protein
MEPVLVEDAGVVEEDDNAGVVNVGVVAVVGGARAQEEAEGAEEAEEEEDDEEEEEEEEEEEVWEGAERVNMALVDAPAAEHFRAGLTNLGEVRRQIDAMDIAIPVAARGHPGAVAARAALLVASEEIHEAFGAVVDAMAAARGFADDAREGNRRLQDEALDLAGQLVALQLQAAAWREEALSNADRLRVAELELADLRAQLEE